MADDLVLSIGESPFSCKGRYFYPSCHQKRVLMFGKRIMQEILYPRPHRQYVFIFRSCSGPI